MESLAQMAVSAPPRRANQSGTPRLSGAGARALNRYSMRQVPSFDGAARLMAHAHAADASPSKRRNDSPLRERVHL